MPLSEHEQRLLEQMERALYQEDPKFATSLRHGRRSGKLDHRRIVVGASAVVAGLVTVVAGVATGWVPVGVLGFAAMVAGSWYALSGASRTTPSESSDDFPPPPPRASRPKKAGGFMGSMEDRWRRRRDEQGGLR